MLIELNGVRPTIAEGVYIAPTAVLIGDVTVGAGSSIWFGAVLRGAQTSWGEPGTSRTEHRTVTTTGRAEQFE